jgi:3-oxoacyl-[acyl-carrier protein] reductase
MSAAPQLDGRVAVVTGGSRGIGRAIAAALVGTGARVMITGLHEERLEEARRLLEQGGGGRQDRLATRVADVREYSQAEALMAETAERFGGLDILVNNAGIGAFAQAADQPVDEWRRVIDTNLTGVFYCTRAAVPHLRRRGGGWVINISSLAGKNPFPGGGAYCASKAALNALSEVLMQELRYDDIRVSYIMPGSVSTAFRGPGALRAARGEAALTGGSNAAPAEADWKLAPDDVATVVLDLLAHPRRSLPSRVELRPSKPRR